MARWNDRPSLGVSPMSSPHRTNSSHLSAGLFAPQVCLHLVFAYLSTADLFRFRMVSRKAYCQVEDYFRRLTRLDLRDTLKTRFIWQHFHLITRHSVSLRSLSLVNVSWIDEDAFITFLHKQPRLKEVDLSRAYKLTNRTLIMLTSCCPSIEKLILRHCHWLSERTFLQMITQCRHLVEIDVTSCWNLSDHCIEVLFSTHGPTLRRVTLSGLYSLTDAWTRDIQTNATCLTFLDVSFCWRQTDNAIK